MNNIVLIESPYQNGDRNRNLRYLTWCEFHSASLGEVPIASHGNCTAYWPEDVEHRAKGFAWRDAVRGACDFVAFYQDLGMSEGQQLAEIRDSEKGVKCIRRKLPDELRAKFEAGEYPPGSMRRISVCLGVERLPRDGLPNLRNDGWTKYIAHDNDVEVGFPNLLNSWQDNEILLELEARGYLNLHAGQYDLVRDGPVIWVRWSGHVLRLAPMG
jgi:hypothetical protein